MQTSAVNNTLPQEHMYTHTHTQTYIQHNTHTVSSTCLYKLINKEIKKQKVKNKQKSNPHLERHSRSNTCCQATCGCGPQLRMWVLWHSGSESESRRCRERPWAAPPPLHCSILISTWKKSSSHSQHACRHTAIWNCKSCWHTTTSNCKTCWLPARTDYPLQQKQSSPAGNVTECDANSQFSSIQDGIYVLKKAHMRSALSLRSFPNNAFEMVLIFVWLMTALSHPFKEDRPVLPYSKPLTEHTKNFHTDKTSSRCLRKRSWC